MARDSVCIIVGAGMGLGHALAEKFLQNGYKIGLISRSSENLQYISKSLNSSAVEWETADAGDQVELISSIAKLKGKLGGCDVLIYNAAILKSENPLKLSPERLMQEMNVNLVGALASAQEVAEDMIRNKKGAILITGGGLALEPYPEWTSLAAGKAALRSLAFSLFKELSPKGVHVAIIAVCGIIESGGPFDPDIIANEYLRLATNADGVKDRELIFQPEGTDVYYNDTDRVHAKTTLAPIHSRK